MIETKYKIKQYCLNFCLASFYDSICLRLYTESSCVLMLESIVGGVNKAKFNFSGPYVGNALLCDPSGSGSKSALPAHRLCEDKIRIVWTVYVSIKIGSEGSAPG